MKSSSSIYKLFLKREKELKMDEGEEHLWEWGEQDEIVPDNEMETFDQLIEHLNNWRVTRKRDTQNPLLVSLSNWVVRNAMPDAISWTEIKLSTIQGGGYGLFATRDVPGPGVYLTVYGGDYYPNSRTYQRETGRSIIEGSNHYILHLENKVALLDGRVGFYLREQGRWANTQLSEADCNATYHEITDSSGEGFWQMRLESTRPIRAGEEIFAWYGEDYLKEMFPTTTTTKKQRVELCIQCQVREGIEQLVGYPQWFFCGRKCATRFWDNNNNGRKGQ